MKTFEIIFHQKIIQEGGFSIQAGSESEARTKAEELFNDGNAFRELDLQNKIEWSDAGETSYKIVSIKP